MHTHIRIEAHTPHTHACTYTYALNHVHKLIHTPTHTNAYAYIHIHAYTRTYIHTDIHTYIHRDTNTYTHA